MVNHIRTLLLNEAGSNKPGYSFPLEEYVPADYLAIKPNDACRKSLIAIFGTYPDRAYKNWRLYQISKITEACGFEKYWYKFDSRVTHFGRIDTEIDSSFGKAVLTSSHLNEIKTITYYASNGGVSVSKDLVSASQTSSEEEVGAFVSGYPSSDESRGRVLSYWQIESGSGGTFSIKRLSDPAYEDNVTLSFSGGLSEAVTLRGSGIQIKFRNNPGNAWDLTVVAMPSTDIGVVMANLDALSPDIHDYLFSSSYPEIKELKRYWDNSIDANERLSAFSIALGYRLEEKRAAS